MLLDKFLFCLYIYPDIKSNNLRNGISENHSKIALKFVINFVMEYCHLLHYVVTLCISVDKDLSKPKARQQYLETMF